MTVYNEISLDGKITGFDGDGVRYYTRGFRWPSDAILMGSVTAEAFGPNESPAEQQRTCRPWSPPGYLPASRSSSATPALCSWSPTAVGDSATGDMPEPSPGTADRGAGR